VDRFCPDNLSRAQHIVIMTTAGPIEVDSDSNEVTIHEVTIHDAELASYFADHGPNERREIVDRAFRVGLMTL
jgi:hypothetical protein